MKVLKGSIPVGRLMGGFPKRKGYSIEHRVLELSFWIFAMVAMAAQNVVIVACISWEMGFDASRFLEGFRRVGECGDCRGFGMKRWLNSKAS